jgi:formate hydrogenlyase transcriptional activator
MHRRIDTIPSSVMDALVSYPWPGNVRELQNVIERAVILSKGPALQIPLSDLKVVPAQPDGSGGGGGAGGGTPAQRAPITLTDAEREHIVAALTATNWVVGGPRGAAARLGMKRSTLQKKMQKLGISRPG